MADNWKFNIKHVNPGEPVEAGVVNRPDRALADRTAYLKDRLDAAEAGRAIMDLDATIAPSVLPGHAVYWNTDRHRYEPAMVVITPDEETGSLSTAPSTECVGLCHKKTAADRGDIVLRGLVTFANLEASVGQTVEAGKYYLSAVSAGKITKQKPPVTAAVCYVLGPRDNCTTDVSVLVCPQIKDSFDEHTHFRIKLTTAPAGNIALATVDGEERASVTAANSTLPGWLPADHATFNGKAPTGAKFGYNIAANPALSRVWPPIPIQSAALLWDKGVNRLGGTEVPLGTDGAAIIDTNGIWWMSDCREDVPWPEINNSVTADQCPREEKMRLTLVFLRLLLGNNNRYVASLDVNENSPVVVTNCDDIPAKTGDLKVDVDFLVQDCAPLTNEDHQLGSEQGGKVFSSVGAPDETLNTNKNFLYKSWVTEGVIAHQLSQLNVSGTWSRPLTNEEKVYHNFVDDNGEPIITEVTLHQGAIKINFEDQYAERELPPQIVRLDDAIERIYNDIPYLAFPAGQSSAIRVRINVPFVNILAEDGLKMKIRALLFKTTGSTVTPSSIGRLFMSYRVIPAPTVDQSYLTLPGNDAEVTDETLGAEVFPASLSAPKDHVLRADSVTFSVNAGATVLVTFSRAADDVTGGEIGLLRVSGLLFK